MPRYVQKINEDGSSTFVEIGQDRPSNSGHFVQGDIEPFVSPVDRSVISDRRQLREHNLRNKVMNTAEFEGQRAAIERQQQKERQQDRLNLKRELWERIHNHE